MQFGEMVRQARMEKHIPQHALAAMAGISQSGICYIEKGKIQAREAVAARIVEALELACDQIVPETPLPPAPVNRESNGDRLRAMADEELLFMINCQNANCRKAYPDRDCYQCKLEWLRSAAKPVREEECYE